MARREARPPAQREVRLTPRSQECVSCGKRLWVAYHAQRTLMTFRGLVRLRLVVRRCRNQECDLYHLPYRAEEEGAWALPHGEFGLDIIIVIGQLRYGEHRSIPEIHQRLVQQGVSIAQRTVTDLLERYEELIALHLADGLLPIGNHSPDGHGHGFFDLVEQGGEVPARAAEQGPC